MRKPIFRSLPLDCLRTSAILVACLLVLVFAPTHGSWADSKIKLLQYGTWGLSIDPDPFKQKFPAVVYVPPGTIVFDSRPGALRNYVSVQLHYGHWVQIEKTLEIKGNPVDILIPIEGLVQPPPSNTIMVHRSILCLGQTNRIVTPPKKCKQVGNDPRSTSPVGKGWIYTFKPSSKSGWVDLFIRLDEGTKTELRGRGLTPAEANFDVTRSDLVDLERHGYLTMLDKKHPLAVFEYQNRHPVYIQCGQKKVTEKALKASAKVKAEGGVGFAAPLWARLVFGLKARLGLTTEVDVSAEAGTTWTISVDTSKAAYLYYAVTMTETATGKTSNIVIEKVFECRPSPNVGPGNKIISVRFEIEPPDGLDFQEFDFTAPTHYLAVPERLYNHHPRPIFLSVNSPEQYETALNKIIERWNVDIHLAHFILTNINYSCTGRGGTREVCAKLIDQPITSVP